MRKNQRPFLSLDKFHECLTTIFPPNEDGADGAIDGDGIGNSHSGEGQQSVGQKDDGNGVASAAPAGGDCGDADGGDVEDHQLHRRQIPVKFSKDAVIMLHRTLEEFLRKLASDLVEDLDDGDDFKAHSRTIMPEDVVRVLHAFDENDDSESEDQPTSGEEAIKGSASNPRSGIDRLEMKAFVAQAQELLLRRDQIEEQQHREESERSGDGTNDGDAKRSAVKQSQQQQDKKAPPTKRRRRKPKKHKIVITAEMEAEQERLLNASKEALESSQQQHQPQQGDRKRAASFRVEMR